MQSANGWIGKVRWWWLAFGAVLFVGSMIVLIVHLNPVAGSVWFVSAGAVIYWALRDLFETNPHVLQRVSIHPASRVEELTPRLWKEHFADNPLRSDIYDSG